MPKPRGDTNAMRNRRVRADIKPDTHKMITKIVERGCEVLGMPNADRALIVHRLELRHKRAPLPLETMLTAPTEHFRPVFEEILWP